MQQADLDRFEQAMGDNNDRGVIIVHWEIEGDPRIIGKGGISYYPWDGSTDYGCYPYATP